MKRIAYISSLLLLTLLSFSSCDEDNYEFGDIVSPSNLNIEIDIVGADSENPYGDGSGVVNFSVNADNALSYKFAFEGSEAVATSGEYTYNFSKTGTHVYTVTVIAIGTGGVATSQAVEVEVLALYAPPQDLLDMLYGDGSRTWRIKNEAAGHFGVGPAEETSPIWYAASPDEKSVTGMYDDRYVFTQEGDFQHLTQGTVFGQAAPLTEDFGGDKGQTANSNNEFENYPLEDYTESWSLSAPGGQETISLTGTAFFGFYVGGSHNYQIISRSENEMLVKTIGNDGNAWFFILIAED
ncbi:hypothetical protein SAMN04487906_0784 [Zhouia amylolytica]|uniref:Glucan endo-1,3-beta-D-glucosidase n=2 Tax=Zhouia amylolytica TaxID=376730 RepID=W2UNW6_9FLAO|nr:hypothetical protein [Zhouia amylolytica]ETN95845.1 hypothetical protein P278_15670 [Zhouia amylolytica AD3]MCQ0112020.1 glucan endo-1,3-beta-D-glucosidase [Zhouia amylolytica]SFS54607.1 hypothetical protein SAMN04487906_0784 [Zhouia amylolytica]